MTYLRALADEIAHEVGEGRPDRSHRDLFLLYAVLALVRGEDADRRDVHEAWVAWMDMRGEEHASMVPFDDLSSDVQAEDEPFAQAIRAVARRHRTTPRS